ncbi:hypothetical protein J6TS2_30300 [Heyndrickxia sporothermodurans]|nr:hypothetical protein J6TS2_30300 [Heyndrickxia sporothermodurans]
MSLIEINQIDIVKKQYFFKLRSYVQIFSTMMILQVIGLLFSIGGVGGSGTSNDNVSVEVSYYSSSTVMMLTFLWAFISAILITTKATRYDDFSFITNRLTSHLSNILFLLTASVIGGITAFLSGYLLKIIIYFFIDIKIINEGSMNITVSEILIGIFASILYVLLTCALGYMVGTLVQLHKIFIVLFPGLLIGLNMWSIQNGKMVIEEITEFFNSESSLVLFFVKVILTTGLLFSSSIAISNRMEVRK